MEVRMRNRVIWSCVYLLALPALFADSGGGGGGSGGGGGQSSLPAPATYQSWYNQGYQAAKGGKFDEAVKDFNEALKLRPNYPEALNMEGYSLRKSGNLSQAFSYYDQALSLRPNFPDAREYYGEACLQAGDLKKAVQQYLILQKTGTRQAKELLAWIDAYVNDKTPPAEDL
jgi:tetratricopeptide (TPR) repeat protein